LLPEHLGNEMHLRSAPNDEVEHVEREFESGSNVGIARR
jgi:hypothetical protein